MIGACINGDFAGSLIVVIGCGGDMDSPTGVGSMIQHWIGIDSGAVDTVGPKDIGLQFPIKPTKESELGLGYRAANGSPIKNYGERILKGQTTEGQGLVMKMTVAQVSKVLASVAKICECGNTVVFDEDGRYIKDKTQARPPQYTKGMECT